MYGYRRPTLPSDVVTSLRVFAAALVACSASTPPLPLGNVAVPTAKPTAIAVQLAYRGTFFIGPPFSSLPPFTLLDDGTLIGIEGNGPVYTTTVSRDEVARIVQHVRDLGFEKLANHTETCKDNPNGTRLCTSDGAYTILRVALPSGTMREITTYEDFSNEPEILSKIVEYLVHHKHPHTAPYRPTSAVMHVQPQTAPPIANCRAIDPALLHGVDGDTPSGVKLEGPELDAILALAPANNGHWFACANKVMYQLTLVPGIPGSDLQAELDVYKPRAE